MSFSTEAKALDEGLEAGAVFPGLCNLFLLVFRAELEEGAAQLIVNHEHRTVVIELPAVVGRAEDRYQFAIGEELVAIVHDLVAAHDQVEVMLLAELLHHLSGERYGCSSIISLKANI